MIKVGFIGAGNMGSALMRAAAASDCAKITLYDTDAAKATALAKELGAELGTPRDISKSSELIFLAVKPSVIRTAAAELAPGIKGRRDCAVISMAAGVTLASVAEALGLPDAEIIRIMPNTPAAIRRGMTLWTKNGAVSDGTVEKFLSVMRSAGELDEIPERLIDAASALSGCGPAFVYMFIEALADGAVQCGLARDKAILYAAQTVAGAAEMVSRTGKHPEELKDAVCSPGGSTIEGVHALEEGAFRASTANAVLAAYEKTVKLGK